MNCTNEACQRLFAAAEALLEARANQMVTAVEWDALHQAVIACGGLDSTGDNPEN